MISMVDPCRTALQAITEGICVVLLKDLCVTCVACVNCFFDSSSENEKKRKEIMAKPVCLIA